MTELRPSTKYMPMTDYEINERVIQLLNGGKLRKMKVIFHKFQFMKYMRLMKLKCHLCF